MKNWTTLVAFLLFSSLSAQSIHTPLRKGDQAYDRKRYKDAEKQYRIAADKKIGDPQAVFNLGNCLFQQGQWADAAQRYQQAAENSNNPQHQADAWHNAGDALLKDRKYKEAVKAYMSSLRIRPGDEATKHNLQMAIKRVREEEKREKEQQQKNQQQQQNQDNQNQDNQNQPNPGQPNPPQKPQDQPNTPPQNQENPAQPPPSAQQKQQETQRLKKEEAKRLLETAVGPDDRKNAQKYRAAQQQSKPKGSKKDW